LKAATQNSEKHTILITKSNQEEQKVFFAQGNK